MMEEFFIDNHRHEKPEGNTAPFNGDISPNSQKLILAQIVPDLSMIDVLWSNTITSETII